MSSPASSSSISFVRLNCCRISCCTNHRAVACAFSGVNSSLPIPSVPVLLTRSALPAVYSGQNASTCCTVCIVHPHPHFASIPGTFIDASHPFSPITSVQSRNSADAWCFSISEYNFKVLCSQGVFHVASLLFLAFYYYLLFHSSSAHSSMVDFSFCGLPGGTLLALGLHALVGPSLSACLTL